GQLSSDGELAPGPVETARSGGGKLAPGPVASTLVHGRSSNRPRGQLLAAAGPRPREERHAAQILVHLERLIDRGEGACAAVEALAEAAGDPDRGGGL